MREMKIRSRIFISLRALSLRIAPRHILKLLWEKHLQDRVSDMSYSYGLFRANEIPAASTGWIFELHQLLREEQTIRLFPINQGVPGPVNFIYRDYPKKNPVDLHWPTRKDTRWLKQTVS